MNKVLAFILSLTLLFQSANFDMSDIYKMSTLIDHLSCHLEEGDSLADFISMHYGSVEVSHKNEHKEHGELPFKHQHLDSHFQMAFLLCGHQYPLEYIEIGLDTKNFNYKEPLTALVVQNFFQPPKIA